ncbi:MAG TPA: T9SS type A sorting domain-containing protein [Ignavibacteriaceae bacterium]
MYSEDFQNPVWQKTDGLHLNQVTNDTLAVWNTAGLQAGQYALVLTLYHTLGDSLALPSSARLNDGSTGIIFSDNDEFGFRLDQNYPNPFNPNTNIRFQIPENGLATLKVYDILGTEITTLISDELSAGNYDFDFDGSKLTSGIYFYRLTTETFSQTRKMILIK